MEKKIPKNWVETNLDTILERITNGSSLKQKEESYDGAYPISRIETIADEEINLKRVKYVLPTEQDIEKFGLKNGDILFSHINSDKHLGKTALFDLDITLIHGINLLLLRTVDQYNPRLLNFLFRHYRYSGKFIEVAQRAVNQSSINQKKLKTFPIPLPPLPEQDRIVAKLDKLFEQLDTIKVSLKKIPVLLKNFRQQVLNQAVMGKLTAADTKVVKLGSLLDDVKYGTSKKSKYDIKGIPVLRIPNIQLGEISDEDLKFSNLDPNEFEKLKLVPGDVLIIRSNGSVSLVGKSAIITEKHRGFSYAGYLIRLRCNNLLDPEFLNYSLESIFMRSQIVETSRSTSGVNNINSNEIKNLNILWPSIKDQKVIVQRVQKLFLKAEKIEKQFAILKEKTSHLPQAILHQAFKGELAPQFDSDGDARELLEEIKELKFSAKKQFFNV